jgi:ferritin-like metal-binding protein YciE
MAETTTLTDLFMDSLKDILFAERQILKALPKMARAATSTDLKTAIQSHRDQTEGQIERLEQIFASMDMAPRGKHCPAIVGILEEGQEILDEYAGSPALDAGIIASAQAVEHYEIVRYGTLATWADLLGLTDASKLLAATLAEEEKSDADLSKLAKARINTKAMAKAAA